MRPLLIALVGGGLAAVAAVLLGSRRASASTRPRERSPNRDPHPDTAPASEAPAPRATRGEDPARGRLLLRTTAYWPHAATEAERRMEGGIEGAAIWRGKRAVDPQTGRRPILYTLEDAVAGRSPYGSLSGDPAAWPWGQRIEIDAWPGVPFRVVDTGQAFRGSGKRYREEGAEPIDVCVRSRKTRVPETTMARFIPGDNWEGGAPVAVANLRGQTVIAGDPGDLCPYCRDGYCAMCDARDGLGACTCPCAAPRGVSGYRILGSWAKKAPAPPAPPAPRGHIVSSSGRERWEDASAGTTTVGWDNRVGKLREKSQRTDRAFLHAMDLTDEESLARALASSCRGGDLREMQAVAWAVRNRAERLGLPVALLVAPRGRYGPRGGGGRDFVPSERDPGEVAKKVARAVLRLPRGEDPTGGAVDFWYPEQQGRAAQLFPGVPSEAEARAALRASGFRAVGVVGSVELLAPAGEVT